MFNSTTLSLYTPDTFILPYDLMDNHDKLVNQGKQYMRSQRVVICTLLRDVSTKIASIIRRTEKIASFFGDYRILIVENDSKDDTRKKLLEWSQKNNKVVVLGCGENVEKCEMKLPKTEGHSVYKSRIDKMVKLRNIYLDEIKERYTDFNYVIVWDMDIIGSVYIDGIQNSFGYFAQDEKSLIDANENRVNHRLTLMKNRINHRLMRFAPMVFIDGDYLRFTTIPWLIKRMESPSTSMPSF